MMRKERKSRRTTFCNDKRELSNYSRNVCLTFEKSSEKMTSVNWIELNSRRLVDVDIIVRSIALILPRLLIYLVQYILQSVSYVCAHWAEKIVSMSLHFLLRNGIISLKFRKIKHKTCMVICWLCSCCCCPLSSRVVNSYFKKLELPFVVDIRHPRNENFHKIQTHTRRALTAEAAAQPRPSAGGIFSWIEKYISPLVEKMKVFLSSM